MERWTFKTSPLYRLTASYEEDLIEADDPELEESLAKKLSDRLKEAEAKRDAGFKSLISIDSILAIVLSGRDFSIPAVGVSTKDIPALLEVLVSIASVSVCLVALSFTTWLCYSQLLFTVLVRSGTKKNVKSSLVTFADQFSELGIYLFSTELGRFQNQLFEPTRGFRVFAAAYELSSRVLFFLIPIIHSLLIIYALMAIVEKAGFTPLHSLLYIAVICGHLLAVLFWIAPTVKFNFMIRPSKIGAP